MASTTLPWGLGEGIPLASGIPKQVECHLFTFENMINIGLGGGSFNECVDDGPFAFQHSGREVTPSAEPYIGVCLRRRRLGTLPRVSQVNRALAYRAGNFGGFFTLLEALHGDVHCAIGGTMCASFQDATGR